VPPTLTPQVRVDAMYVLLVSDMESHVRVRQRVSHHAAVTFRARERLSLRDLPCRRSASPGGAPRSSLTKAGRRPARASPPPSTA